MTDARLADRTATLTTSVEPGNSPLPNRQSEQSSDSQRIIPAPVFPTKQPTPEPSPSLAELLKGTRADLSEAQRSRSELQEKLNRLTAEFEKLRTKNSQYGRRINAIESERVNLQLRLKDRDEELKGKAKLLEVSNTLNLEFFFLLSSL